MSGVVVIARVGDTAYQLRVDKAAASTEIAGRIPQQQLVCRYLGAGFALVPGFVLGRAVWFGLALVLLPAMAG